MDDIINAMELTSRGDKSLGGFLVRVSDSLKGSSRIFREKFKISTAGSKSLKGMRKFIFLNDFVVGSSTCPSFWKLAAKAILAPRGFLETFCEVESKI